MSKEEQNGFFAKPVLAVVLIFGRYLVTFGLGMLPIIICLKNEWYVMPLVVLNFVLQFALAKMKTDRLFIRWQ